MHLAFALAHVVQAFGPLLLVNGCCMANTLWNASCNICCPTYLFLICSMAVHSSALVML
jgi:hypothetical protein